MIDPEARIELLREQRADPRSPWSSSTWFSATAPTPTRPAVLAPVCERSWPTAAAGRRLRARHRAGPAGLHRPAGPSWSQAGCIVTETAARASLVAAAIATGDPSLVAIRTVNAARRNRRARVALVTYSTKPRGGVVHTLSLAEAMVEPGDAGPRRRARRPRPGFFRPVRAPYTLVPAAATGRHPGGTGVRLDRRPRGGAERRSRTRWTSSTPRTASRPGPRPGSATPAPAVRVVRTVHHVDDFTTAALIDCQRKAIEEPDQLVVVSEDWRTRLKAEYGARRRRHPQRGRRGPLRGRSSRPGARPSGDGAGIDDRFVFLSVGGIEPRKGSTFLFQAMAILARELDPAPALVVVGGHSFQDYTRYRDDALAMLPGLGLELGRDVILAGTVSDAELPDWYRSADALAFPSVKEGWGLAVLEAMAADLPVVSSDIAVLREYLTPDETAVLTRVGDPESLAAGMARLITDGALRDTLIRGGRALVPAFSWDRAAAEHARLYPRCPADATPRPPPSMVGVRGSEPQTVQVCMISAPARRAVSTASSTSSGLIGLTPSIMSTSRMP